MTSCQELAARIERLQPGAAPQDVARLCLLLANRVENLAQLDNDERLAEAWHDINLCLQAVTDQHAAMTEELDNLSRAQPNQFGPEQIWVLIRAIKVQSQILQMYVGDAGSVDV